MEIPWSGWSKNNNWIGLNSRIKRFYGSNDKTD